MPKSVCQTSPLCAAGIVFFPLIEHLQGFVGELIALLQYFPARFQLQELVRQHPAVRQGKPGDFLHDLGHAHGHTL